jgi:hypothetical protein
MTIETFVAGLSRSEKILAMELIWRDLRTEGDGQESPSWHDEEVNRRLANPLAGEALGIKDALAEIRGWRNDRKTSS